MIIGGKELAGLTGEICEVFGKRLAAKVLQAIKSLQCELGDQYDETVQGHFRSVAFGAFDLSLANPLAEKFLDRRNTEELVWLMLSKVDGSIGEQTAKDYYAANEAEVNAWIKCELQKKNRGASENPSSEDCLEKSPLATCGE